MNIGELFIELGFKADQIKLNEFIKSIGDLKMSSVMATLGLAGVYETAQKIMGVADESALSMNLFSKETGMSAEKMKSWTQFAEQMGIKGETMSSALTTLQSKLIGLKGGWDQSLLTPFMFLNRAGAGITGREDPFELINKVRKGLKGLSPEMQKQTIEWLGLNTEILAVLKQEDNVWEDINKQLTPSTEQVKKIMEYHKEINKLSQHWNLLLTDAGGYLAPVIAKLDHLATSLLELSTGNKDQERLGKRVKNVGAAVGEFGMSMSPIKNLWELFAYGIKDAELSLLHNKVPAMAGASSVNNKNQNNTYHISIMSPDPKESGRQIMKAIKENRSDEYEKASQETSQGGR